MNTDQQNSLQNKITYTLALPSWSRSWHIIYSLRLAPCIMLSVQLPDSCPYQCGCETREHLPEDYKASKMPSKS